MDKKRAHKSVDSRICVSFAAEVVAMPLSKLFGQMDNVQLVQCEMNNLDYLISDGTSNMCVVVASSSDMLSSRILSDRVATLMMDWAGKGTSSFSFFVMLSRNKNNQKSFSDRQVQCSASFSIYIYTYQFMCSLCGVSMRLALFQISIHSAS
jgi:hypothetical protein